MDPECDYLLNEIRNPLDTFLRATLKNSTNLQLTRDACVRIHVSLHQPITPGADSTRIVEAATLVCAGSWSFCHGYL